MFSTIKQGLLILLKQRTWVLFNAFFGIFAMVLLGAVLSGAFSDNLEEIKVNICYFDDGESKEIINNLKSEVIGDDIEFSEVKSIEEGKNKVMDERKIFLIFEKEKIKVYYSEKLKPEGAILMSTLKSYSKTSATINEMYKIDSNKATEIMMSEEDVRDEIELQTIEGEKSPNSYQYYGVVELNMMIFYIVMFPISLISGDRQIKMKERIMLSGLSQFKYFFSRIISSWILGIIIIIPGYLFSIFVLHAKWGENPVITFIYPAFFALMMSTLGTMVGYLFKEKEKGVLIIQGLIIPVMSFLGGAYVVLPQKIDGFFNVITNISPLRWLNKGVFQLAFEGTWEYLNISLIISLSLSFIFIVILYLGVRRERKLS